MNATFAPCAVVLCALWSAAAGVSGQAPQAPGQAPAAVFRSAVDLVALNVIVTDASHRFVTGLRPSDFVVLEDGVAQEVTFFSAGETPLDVALLLDTSASMSSQLPAVRVAARGFLRAVRDIDRVMILDLKNTTRILHPLNGNVPAAHAAIDSIRAEGTTGLYNGLYLTMRQLVSARGPASARAVRRQAIVVLSDGHDTSSLVSFDDVLEMARRTGIATYPIQLQSFAGRRPAQVARVLSNDEYSLRELAGETGGRAFFPERIEELADVYGMIATELGSQYALGYIPKTSGVAGQFRRVSVQVADRPGVRTRTRAGYVLGASRAGT